MRDALLALAFAGLAGCTSNEPNANPPARADGSASAMDASDPSDPGDDASPEAEAEAGADAGVDAPADATLDPFEAGVRCTSGVFWAADASTSDVDADHDMMPGTSCGTCHYYGGAGYPFDVAGTVYATAHEPDDCYGASDVTVVVTDATGKDHALAVSKAGSFFNRDVLGVGRIPTPYVVPVPPVDEPAGWPFDCCPQ